MSIIRYASKQFGNKTFEYSNEVEKVALDVIIKEKLGYLNDAKIGYISVLPHISKICVGRCIRSSKELKFFSNFDYVIEVSGELWNSLSDETKYILIHHELLHIRIEVNKDSELIYKLVDHNIKDFYTIIKKHGIDWFNDIKVQAASVYDLDPEDQDKISL